MKPILLPGCPFCAPEIHDAQFRESEHFRAIYNIAPILPGHSLIIPKYHAESVFDLADAELSEMIFFSRAVIRLLLDVFGVQGFNWTIQEREEAGQTVPHLHLHLVPRRQNDLPQPGDWYPRLIKSETDLMDSDLRGKLTADEIKAIVAHIRSHPALGGDTPTRSRPS